MKNHKAVITALTVLISVALYVALHYLLFKLISVLLWLIGLVL